MNKQKKTISIHFINSVEDEFSIELSIHNQLDNLMELIRDNDYEEWGECGGRTWCRTCHVSIDKDTQDAISEDEAHALSLLSSRKESSRLACQIDINETLDGATLRYLGDV